jgi:hypothetical protein
VLLWVLHGRSDFYRLLDERTVGFVTAGLLCCCAQCTYVHAWPTWHHKLNLTMQPCTELSV